MASVILKSGREKSLLRRHPWLFSGALARVDGTPQPGETVDVLGFDGTLLGRGAYSPHSQISVRLWTFDSNQEIGSPFFRDRLERAIRGRHRLMAGHGHAACRLVNAESDGLPGIIVDRYADFLVCQFLSAGAEFWKQVIVDHLKDLVPAAGIFERSDLDVRLKEGLQPRKGPLSGQVPPDLILIQEGPHRFWVDVLTGQKTGFYLDQRENRVQAAEYAQGAEVLNCFAYTGGFGVFALGAGAAMVTNVESSATALGVAKQNIELNGFDQARVENTEGDAFHILRKYRDSRRQFDLIILDPPKFAESRSQVERAARGYKDINLLAFKLLRSGGILFTFSCSGLVGPDLFQKIVADAALDAGRDA
ncbi:MAG: class I SAM-dependent methyltransferase, partial [Desulfobacterales bacterium]|nr:class I SAM-dependent methyltransferase [Desulfobacterales bacterium]